MGTRYQGRWNTNIVLSTAGHYKENVIPQFVHNKQQQESTFLE